MLGCFKLIWKQNDCELEPVLHYLSEVRGHAEVNSILSYIMQLGWAFIDYFANALNEFWFSETKDHFWCCKMYSKWTKTYLFLQQIFALDFAVSRFDRTWASIFIFLILRLILNIICVWGLFLDLLFRAYFTFHSNFYIYINAMSTVISF